MQDTLSYIQMLNVEQKKAVLHSGNPLLILAGAGSGKTRVITTKIAYLIRECGVHPQSILAVTFTNRAAKEMAERACRIDERAQGAMIRTFHSFGAWFLRRHSFFTSLSKHFVIYDEDDQVSLLSTIVKNYSKEELKVFIHNIARAKDYYMGPDHPDLNYIDNREEFRFLYKRYEEKLHNIGNADFGDLIKMPVDILRENPDMADAFRSRFEVILIDEYQDTNIAQFELLRALYNPSGYVCVVGDDDQSIYHFRGAEVRNILDFPYHFANTEIIKLECNYRSTEFILQAASSVVRHNKNRLPKELYAQRGSGKMPVLAFIPNQKEEAEFWRHSYCWFFFCKRFRRWAMQCYR